MKFYVVDAIENTSTWPATRQPGDLVIDKLGVAYVVDKNKNLIRQGGNVSGFIAPVQFGNTAGVAEASDTTPKKGKKIAHNLNSTFPHVVLAMKNTDGTYEAVYADIIYNTANTLTIVTDVTTTIDVTVSIIGMSAQAI